MEERQRKRIRSMFGTMVSADVLRYLENNPGSFSLSGRKVEATMFFSDVTGFTGISESLGPERLSELLNRYLNPMTEIIMERMGYVDKFQGDMIMAEWGIPFPLEDHALRACLAALEQQARVNELQPALREEFGFDLHVRMGINSGIVTAGNMGSNRRFQYSVMGDAVNLAARLEPANKDYGTRILIGNETRALAGDAIEVRLLDRIIVAGKTHPLNIFELLGASGTVEDDRRTAAACYEQALNLYWKRRWEESLARLDEALRAGPGDPPSRALQERVRACLHQPPPEDWTGDRLREDKY